MDATIRERIQPRISGTTYGVLLALFVGLSVNYLAGWLLLPSLRFTWPALGIAPALFAWILPLAVIHCLPTDRRGIRILAAVALGPAVLWTALYSLAYLWVTVAT